MNTVNKDNNTKKIKRPLRRDFMLIFTVLLVGMVGGVLLFNNTLLEKYYINNKVEAITSAYKSVNDAMNSGDILSDSFNIELMRICERYNIDVIVADENSNVVKSSSPDYFYLQQKLWGNMLGFTDDNGKTIILIEKNKYMLQIDTDERTGTDYMEMFGFLDNGNVFMIRSALEGIKDSVRISNNFMTYVAFGILIIGSVLSYFLARRITKPISKLTEISNQMKALDFDAKYTSKHRNELDLLGENINELSETLEKTISELKTANLELKKDIESKEKIDKMRSEFLSNVSHELKTPIALIQGYAEGLQDGIVDDDPDSRKYYCDVIVDEAGKMNKMVKQLMTLNELEFGKNTINMERFDIVTVIQNYLKSADILARQKNVTVQMQDLGPVYVWADEFKTWEVLQNYYSNAINHIGGDRIIKISLTKGDGVVRVSVFNTGDPIPGESLDHIWEKFYKVDKARTREYGGSGVGLSIVKAIMDSMDRKYGVINHEDGVEFWFELETRSIDEQVLSNKAE